MNVPYTRAPHQGGPGMPGPDSLHAALLIDFDNVTMGMRSDLSKELKSLLDSDVIKGKVSVQRAYADWRRYPQYIVPLSEASVDLIFAPAYGSNKKNATDIRMAIDAVELVFIRPEIGTYILLTGDSDFSSLVLKLKEYGKYVIGVGIQESSSDILVQNCDEYYSYTSLTGLTKTTDLSTDARDPWVLVKAAVTKMVSRGDVMRSDRLKQVMQELDSSFDERSLGFSKFSKFLAEASSRGLVKLRKLENGQYEVDASKGRSRRGSSDDGRGVRRERGRGPRREHRDRRPPQTATPGEVGAGGAEPSAGDVAAPDPLQHAYTVLTDALRALREAGREPVRDSDVKRKILERDPTFDEAELGFSKFSLFLSQAAAHGIVQLDRRETGNLDVSLVERVDGTSELADAASEESLDGDPISGRSTPPDREVATPEPEAVPPEAAAREPAGPTVIDVSPPREGQGGLRLGPRRGSTRRRGGDTPPPFFEGQTTGSSPAAQLAEAPAASGAGLADAPEPSTQGLEGLGLPTDPGAIVRYLTHRYKGVGEKTAETLVEHFGARLFTTMHNDADAIARAIPANRAEQLLEAWRSDYERRTGVNGGGDDNGDGGSGSGRRGGRGRGRGRRGRS